MRFTTRPEFSGSFGMATSTHWIASATGMGVLKRGGQGTAPAGVTVEHYRSEGLTLIPGAGLLATVIPAPSTPGCCSCATGAPGGCATCWSPRSTTRGTAMHCCQPWRGRSPTTPTSSATSGPPRPRLAAPRRGARGPRGAIEAARDAFYRGFVAEAVGANLKDACVADSTGERRRGVLTAADMAG